jgi:hypothetical protein
MFTTTRNAVTALTALLTLAVIPAAGCGEATPEEEMMHGQATQAQGKADGWQPGTAPTWDKLLTCDSGAAELDVNDGERRNMQFVIRDQNIIKYLNDAGAIQSAYGATEAIFSGWTGSVDWNNSLGPRLANGAQPYGGPGVFSAGDFSEFIADHNYYEGGFGHFVRVARDSGGIKLQIGSIEKRGCAQSETSYVGDGFGYVTNCVADYSEYVEKANWFFQSCQ